MIPGISGPARAKSVNSAGPHIFRKPLTLTLIGPVLYQFARTERIRTSSDRSETFIFKNGIGNH